ncbi:MAG: amidohydrolase family protein [Chloroflexi bacterium]|nr:amidohydrolase family protein [Chloroflexota bacterium]
MVDLDLLLRRGIVCTSSSQARVDLGIASGRVAQIGGEMHAQREIDVSGKLLLPGGVDAHVHLSQPPARANDRGPRWVDDFTSGSAAALAGGVTSVGNMTFVGPDEALLDGLERETDVASRTAAADVFLHPVVVSPRPDVLEEIPRLLAHAGCSSIKIFLPTHEFDASATAYTEAIRRAGASGLVSMLHCEDFGLLEHATAQLVAAGKTSPRFFGDSRPVVAEVVATQRAVGIAEVTGAPVYIVHLSSRRALEVCADAQARGLPVYVETRPLYLYLTGELFEREDAGKYVGQPPLRGRADLDALWAGIRQGTVNTVCTDHAPWSLQAKLDPELSVTKLRPGVENLQTLIPMLYSEGVGRGRISMSRLIEVTSTNAAKLFGLYPRKGTIAVGSDADLVVIDPDLERVIEPSTLKSNADYSVYDGWAVTGWPVLTLRRGEIAYEGRRDHCRTRQRGSASLQRNNALVTTRTVVRSHELSGC